MTEYLDSRLPGKDYYCMDGSTAPDTRKVCCKYFNKATNYRMRLFSISTKAGGLGINLVAAKKAWIHIFEVLQRYSNITQMYSHITHVLLMYYSHVTHRLLTRYSHVTHTLLTHYSHITHTLLTCYSHVTHTLLTCYSHVTHTLLTRYSHITQVLLTRYSHVTHILLRYY